MDINEKWAMAWVDFGKISDSSFWEKVEPSLIGQASIKPLQNKALSISIFFIGSGKFTLFKI